MLLAEHGLNEDGVVVVFCVCVLPGTDVMAHDSQFYEGNDPLQTARVSFRPPPRMASGSNLFPWCRPACILHKSTPKAQPSMFLGASKLT